MHGAATASAPTGRLSYQAPVPGRDDSRFTMPDSPAPGAGQRTQGRRAGGSEAGWISGSCPGCSDQKGNTFGHLIERKAESILEQFERVEAGVSLFRDDLGISPVEFAALGERMETISEELRWLRDRMGRIVGRLEQSVPPQPGTSGHTPF